MASGDSNWTLRREIPSDTSVASELVNELIGAMNERGWPEQDILRTHLAYEEAVVNAIRHGNKGSREKSVVVEITCTHRRVTIQITDQGEGFDPDSVPDPRSEELLETPGGRGVLLIGEVMNHVFYNDQGNQITMEKVR